MSFEQVFHRHYSSICNYITSYINDSHKAEDIAQELFIDLYKKNNLQLIDNIEAYLLKAAKYKVIDHIRSKKNRFIISHSHLEDQSLEIPMESESNMAECDIEPMFIYFMSQLPEKTRETFILSRVENLSYKEIAQKRKLSIKTIENQMSAALKVLKALVAKALCLFF